MISVSLAGNLLASLIALPALVALRDVIRLTTSPAVRRGWQVLVVAIMLCIAIVTVKAFDEAHKPLDTDVAARLAVHLVGASIVTALCYLVRRTAEDIIRLAAFEVQAFTDVLTGLGNRRLFTERLEEETARARDAGTPLSLIVLDIDHFKRINDTHGHAAGDVVLRHIADAVMAGMRNADTVCRIGGEEFVIIMPRINPVQAAEMAGALRAAVGALVVPLGDGRAIAATVSLGLATRQPDEGGDSLFRRADAALYAAKRAGRDRVMLAA